MLRMQKQTWVTRFPGTVLLALTYNQSNLQQHSLTQQGTRLEDEFMQPAWSGVFQFRMNERQLKCVKN